MQKDAKRCEKARKSETPNRNLKKVAVYNNYIIKTRKKLLLIVIFSFPFSFCPVTVSKNNIAMFIYCRFGKDPPVVEGQQLQYRVFIGHRVFGLIFIYNSRQNYIKRHLLPHFLTNSPIFYSYLFLLDFLKSFFLLLLSTNSS